MIVMLLQSTNFCRCGVK